MSNTNQVRVWRLIMGRWARYLAGALVILAMVSDCDFGSPLPAPVPALGARVVPVLTNHPSEAVPSAATSRAPVAVRLGVPRQ
jgi:hypothetical protein